MYIDTDMLRMGADFSDSAATIIQRGAADFSSTRLSVGVFGDFEAARGFHGALTAAHQTHATTMDGHRTELDAIAQKATCAATMFLMQDEQAAGAVDAAGNSLT
ncbi:DUF2563 family protein [Mycolicibacterium sp. 624]|uniref:DUF2563 family protein n=1 Tax=Mycolicibacterium sp. 624 TaxID=3156314 RepID=UPI003398E9A6